MPKIAQSAAITQPRELSIVVITSLVVFTLCAGAFYLWLGWSEEDNENGLLALGIVSGVCAAVGVSWYLHRRASAREHVREMAMIEQLDDDHIAIGARLNALADQQDRILSAVESLAESVRCTHGSLTALRQEQAQTIGVLDEMRAGYERLRGAAGGLRRSLAEIKQELTAIRTGDDGGVDWSAEAERFTAATGTADEAPPAAANGRLVLVQRAERN